MINFRSTSLMLIVTFFLLSACNHEETNQYSIELRSGDQTSIHKPLYSPYGKQISLEASEAKGLAGQDHLKGSLLVGDTTGSLPHQQFIVARAKPEAPYTLLTLDKDHDGDFQEEETMEISANESRGKYWSSFNGVELEASYMMGSKLVQVPYPISMWMVVEDPSAKPDVIRFSRRGFRITEFMIEDFEAAVIVSDANNDGLFAQGDWWYIRPSKTQEKLRESRKIGDFAWLNGQAWKLSLLDEAGMHARLTKFDPGITEEADLESRDLYKADKEAAKAKIPLEFSADYTQTIALAQQNKQVYFIKFEAVWCGPCKLMDKYVYTAESVVEAAEDVLCVKVDADEQPDLKEKYAVNGLPTGILFAADGQELHRFEGYKSVKSMEAFFKTKRKKEML